MTIKPLPWEQITTPVTDFNVRLVGRDLGIPVFWGKDSLGHWLTIIELQGDHSTEFGREPLVVHGIGIDLRAGETAGTQRLVLTLQRQVDADLFLGLCDTLISALAPVTDSTVAMSVALTHIRRWKAFWSGKRSGLLSAEQVRGLFAELQFLKELYQSRMASREAVDAWYGADRVQQDFIFRDTSVEVKSLSGRERNAVRISSEDQLETLSSRLFLKVFRLSDLPDSPLAQSLNQLVGSIESELQDADAIEGFLSKMAAAGYAPLQDYDTPSFVVSAVHTFAVTDGFPRLVRSGLPQGIARLSYDLELESIAGFECTDADIVEVKDGPAG